VNKIARKEKKRREKKKKTHFTLITKISWADFIDTGQ
jgi:hypothetical protein